MKTIICTDSLSITKALAKNYKGVLKLPFENPNILTLWIPSHIGIEENEYADRFVKNAISLGNDYSSVLSKYYFESISYYF